MTDPASWRAINLALLAIVALFTVLMAWKLKSWFGWLAAATAIVSAVSMYFDLSQRELGERRS